MIFQHEDDGYPVAELSADSIVLSTAQEFLQVMMNAGGDRIIIHKSNLDDNFFDLSTGVAGEMLQKVVNYQLRLAIVGDFSMYESKSLKAFITESNRSNTIVFVGSVEEGLKRLRMPTS